ncbi:hypothetical protein ACFRKE_05955 [Kitasatospora indigofera]
MNITRDILAKITNGDYYTEQLDSEQVSGDGPGITKITLNVLPE